MSSSQNRSTVERAESDAHTQLSLKISCIRERRVMTTVVPSTSGDRPIKGKREKIPSDGL